MRSKLVIGLGLAISSLGMLFLAPLIQAERLESNSYVIQFGNFNMGSGTGTGDTNYQMTYTLGQTAAGPYGNYSTTNYFLGSGFQYIYQIQEFAFTISDLDIDLGILSHGVLSQASHDLTVRTRGAGGYTIYTYELRPLTHHLGEITILDTTCDNNNCDQTQAAIWENEEIPGFGFNASGPHVSSDFVGHPNFFRQFANRAGGETMQTIASSAQIATDEVTTITYQASIAGDQAAGSYQTGVVFVAVPGY